MRDNDTEPDYRFTLANERTFLAWQRTAPGLWRWRQVDQAMRQGTSLPRHPTPAYLAIGLGGIGLLVLGALLFRAVNG